MHADNVDTRSHRLKHLFDLVASSVGLLLLSPLLLLLALGIRLTMGPPVLFRQERPGLGEQRFTLFKFRTMRSPQYPGEPDTARLTRLGRFLRKTSLDELPTLYNVVRGEMSLVGPRPLLPRYLPYYTERERLRHTVRPGLTGWAQIHGRNLLPWNERLAMDVWYVENASLALDLRILLKTLAQVPARRGVLPTPDTHMRDLDVERAENGLRDDD